MHRELLYSGQAVDSVTSELPSYSFNSLSVRNFELESGNFVDATDAVYSNSVIDVECMDGHCNKRISTAGPEWSAGRPGHTPIRRDFACVSQLEDRCAGPERSAGRPSHRLFGARLPACTSNGAGMHRPIWHRCANSSTSYGPQCPYNSNCISIYTVQATPA